MKKRIFVVCLVAIAVLFTVTTPLSPTPAVAVVNQGTQEQQELAPVNPDGGEKGDEKEKEEEKEDEKIYLERQVAFVC